MPPKGVGHVREEKCGTFIGSSVWLLANTAMIKTVTTSLKNCFEMRQKEFRNGFFLFPNIKKKIPIRCDKTKDGEALAHPGGQKGQVFI